MPIISGVELDNPTAIKERMSQKYGSGGFIGEVETISTPEGELRFRRGYGVDAGSIKIVGGSSGAYKGLESSNIGVLKENQLASMIQDKNERAQLQRQQDYATRRERVQEIQQQQIAQQKAEPAQKLEAEKQTFRQQYSQAIFKKQAEAQSQKIGEKLTKDIATRKKVMESRDLVDFASINPRVSSSVISDLGRGTIQRNDTQQTRKIPPPISIMPVESTPQTSPLLWKQIPVERGQGVTFAPRSKEEFGIFPIPTKREEAEQQASLFFEKIRPSRVEEEMETKSMTQTRSGALFLDEPTPQPTKELTHFESVKDISRGFRRKQEERLIGAYGGGGAFVAGAATAGVIGLGTSTLIGAGIVSAPVVAGAGLVLGAGYVGAKGVEYYLTPSKQRDRLLGRTGMELLGYGVGAKATQAIITSPLRTKAIEKTEMTDPEFRIMRSQQLAGEGGMLAGEQVAITTRTRIAQVKKLPSVRKEIPVEITETRINFPAENIMQPVKVTYGAKLIPKTGEVKMGKLTSVEELPIQVFDKPIKQFQMMESKGKFVKETKINVGEHTRTTTRTVRPPTEAEMALYVIESPDVSKLSTKELMNLAYGRSSRFIGVKEVGTIRKQKNIQGIFEDQSTIPTIKIRKDLPLETKKKTLWHELSHAFDLSEGMIKKGERIYASSGDVALKKSIRTTQEGKAFGQWLKEHGYLSKRHYPLEAVALAGEYGITGRKTMSPTGKLATDRLRESMRTIIEHTNEPVVFPEKITPPPKDVYLKLQYNQKIEPYTRTIKQQLEEQMFTAIRLQEGLTSEFTTKGTGKVIRRTRQPKTEKIGDRPKIIEMGLRTTEKPRRGKRYKPQPFDGSTPETSKGKSYISESEYAYGGKKYQQSSVLEMEAPLEAGIPESITPKLQSSGRTKFKPITLSYRLVGEGGRAMLLPRFDSKFGQQSSQQLSSSIQSSLRERGDVISRGQDILRSSSRPIVTDISIPKSGTGYVPKITTRITTEQTPDTILESITDPFTPPTPTPIIPDIRIPDGGFGLPPFGGGLLGGRRGRKKKGFKGRYAPSVYGLEIFKATGRTTKEPRMVGLGIRLPTGKPSQMFRIK